VYVALIPLALAALTAGCKRESLAAEGRAEVQPPERSDERLEREVRAKLFGDPELSGGGSIVVIVDGRRVFLQGWVASVNERTLAEADAATVAGVAAVDDRLLVRRTGAPPSK
jgi:osmotically-inducible protein OsmY